MLGEKNCIDCICYLNTFEEGICYIKTILMYDLINRKVHWNFLKQNWKNTSGPANFVYDCKSGSKLRLLIISANNEIKFYF